MKKIFILGVGAQKCGTTWLYGYLLQDEKVNMGALKEYHIWDALAIEECGKFIAKKEDGLRFYLQDSPAAYVRYFESLLSGGCSITGDITPSYSGLSVDNFEFIRKLIESAGFELKVVFLMRDPFERCWSAVRMARRNGNIESTEVEQLRASYKTHAYVFRTDYKKTIESIESVFDKNQIFIGLYEEIFEQSKLEKLSIFLGVDFNPDFVRNKFNTSRKIDLNAMELREEIRGFYSHVYEYCFERFPQTKILWS